MANGLRSRTSPVGCGAGAGVDSAWEQEKLEATLREMLEKAARRPCGRQSQRPVHAVLGVRLQALMLDIRSHQNRAKLQFFCPIRSFV
jgi:hypothetical protein